MILLYVMCCTLLSKVIHCIPYKHRCGSVFNITNKMLRQISTDICLEPPTQNSIQWHQCCGYRCFGKLNIGRKLVHFKMCSDQPKKGTDITFHTVRLLYVVDSSHFCYHVALLILHISYHFISHFWTRDMKPSDNYMLPTLEKMYIRNTKSTQAHKNCMTARKVIE